MLQTRFQRTGSGFIRSGSSNWSGMFYLKGSQGRPARAAAFTANGSVPFWADERHMGRRHHRSYSTSSYSMTTSMPRGAPWARNGSGCLTSRNYRSSIWGFYRRSGLIDRNALSTLRHRRFRKCANIRPWTIRPIRIFWQYNRAPGLIENAEKARCCVGF